MKKVMKYAKVAGLVFGGMVLGVAIMGDGEVDASASQYQNQISELEATIEEKAATIEEKTTTIEELQEEKQEMAFQLDDLAIEQGYEMEDESERLEEPTEEVEIEEETVVIEEPQVEETTVEVTREFDNALSSARGYLRVMNFSHSSLAAQLEFEGFPQDAIAWAMEQIDAETDWYAQAIGSAEGFMAVSSFSHSSLVSQLEFGGFTNSQAVHGANAVFN